MKEEEEEEEVVDSAVARELQVSHALSLTWHGTITLRTAAAADAAEAEENYYYIIRRSSSSIRSRSLMIYFT